MPAPSYSRTERTSSGWPGPAGGSSEEQADRRAARGRNRRMGRLQCTFAAVAPAPWLSLLETIADRADEIALRHFRRDGLRVEEKPDLSPVTEADQAIEETARALVRQKHPDLGILGEEMGATAGTNGSRLIIDPIDGTRNYVRGIPV